MSRTRRRTAATDIPDDIWMKILFKLPANLVAKLRCFSKSFRALIDHPEFFHRYCDVHVLEEPAIILSKQNSGNTSIDYRMDPNSTNLHDRLSHPLKQSYPSVLAGSCMGILFYKLWRKSGHRLMFWNPLTGFYRNVQTSHNAGCLFLGHDSVTNDIKVLNLKRSLVEIFSLKNKCWGKKNIDGMERYESVSDWEGCRSCAQPGGVFVEGTNCTHFDIDELDDFTNIWGFDFAAEKFIKVLLPKPKDQMIHPGLSCLSGNLCFHHQNFKILNVWMMKDYGIEDSWIKLSIHHSIYNWNLVPLALVKNGQQLLFLTTDSYTGGGPGNQMHNYDVENKHFTKHHLIEEIRPGDHKYRHASMTRALLYSPSLQSS